MPATFRSCEPDRMLLPALAVRGEPAEGAVHLTNVSSYPSTAQTPGLRAHRVLRAFRTGAAPSWLPCGVPMGL